MKKVSAKQRMLETLTKSNGYNTFSVAQARARFGITNVAARIAELRQEGYSIYTNLKTRGDGSKVAVYRLGSPSKSFKAQCRANGVRPQAV
ncbi:MAG: Helix-turn-helix domain [Candidatus Parcubacteria bacterium]|jgi:biotin operon repressor